MSDHPHQIDRTINVLVMDDVTPVRKRIVELLAELPIHEILEAETAPDAVCLAARFQPRIAILDIEVPGSQELRNGITVLKWMRANSPQTEVVMLTNFDIPYYRKNCKLLGAKHYFDKSRDFQQLPAIVAQLLQSQGDPETALSNRSEPCKENAALVAVLPPTERAPLLAGLA